MSQLSDELIEAIHNINNHTIMYASTPDEAHGQVVTIAWVVLRYAINTPPAKCSQVLTEMLFEATRDVRRVPSQVVHLCDETLYPERRTSFEAFQRHSRHYLELLKAHVEKSEH